MVFFLIFSLFFLEFSVTRRIGTKRNYNLYFLSFSTFSNQFWLEMNPQWYFFGIFFYASGRNETKRKFLFSIFLLLFRPILVWNEAVMVFFECFRFFFLEFSVTRRIGTKRNYNFYFLCFSSFSNQFWLEMNPQWYFLIF